MVLQMALYLPLHICTTLFTSKWWTISIEQQQNVPLSLKSLWQHQHQVWHHRKPIFFIVSLTTKVNLCSHLALAPATFCISSLLSVFISCSISSFSRFSAVGSMSQSWCCRKLSSMSQSNLCWKASRKKGIVLFMLMSLSNSLEREVTSLPFRPQGTMCLNQDKSVLQLRDTPWLVM